MQPLTYINYWTEHSSNDSSAEVQGAVGDDVLCTLLGGAMPNLYL